MSIEQTNVIVSITENRAGIVLTFNHRSNVRQQLNVDGRLLPDHGFVIEPNDRVRLEFETMAGNMQTRYEFRNEIIEGQRILRHSPYPIPVAVIGRANYHLMKYRIFINDIEMSAGPIQLRPLEGENRVLGGDTNFKIGNIQAQNVIVGSNCRGFESAHIVSDTMSHTAVQVEEPNSSLHPP